MALTTYNIIKV